MKKVGILGLPGAGKSTLFEILMQSAGASPAAAARDRVGVVRVPDARVDRLSALFAPRRTVHTQIQFVDSAAAGQGRPGRGADLFAGLRTCDMLVAVVRDFENPAVPVAAGVDPGRDLRELEAELALNDLAIVETRLERVDKELKVGKRDHEREAAVLRRCRVTLEAGQPLRELAFEAEAERLLRGFQLLTARPLLVVYNQDDRSTREPPPPGANAQALRLRALTEREIVTLPEAERAAFRAGLGVVEDGLSLVIRACYQLLGLIAFFTVGPDEVRAWTLRGGGTAVDAAGEIHSDLARGFIRAEVVPCDQLLELGGLAKARERGVLRLEGRDYRVQDGDCVEIRHNA